MAKTVEKVDKGGPGHPGKHFGHGTDPRPAEGSDRQCVATNRKGERCKQWTIPGATVCRFHGGAAAHVQRAAAQRIAEGEARARLEDEVATLGLPVDVEPAVALMQELHRTAGAVAWLGGIVAKLEEAKVTQGVSKIVRLPDGTQRTEVEAAINVWVKLWHDERDRLARVARMALEAGIAERHVRIAEAQAELMAGALRRILERLGVANHPDAPQIVREELTRLSDSASVNGSARLVGSGSTS